ncbi:MAG: PilZ domain-containing protein [Planctomycetota bacterium]
MSLAASELDRRRENRYRSLTGQKMSWSRLGYVGPRQKGWVMDISKSGIGLMIEQDQLPEVGEVLGVRLRPASDPLSYEVVRVQSGDHRITVVGCERVYGRTADLNFPRPGWSATRAQAA